MMARGDSDGNYSPSRKLGSIVLGDGSFEALMKERSKVSTAVPLILLHTNSTDCQIHIDI